jgi:hypothetical protein
VQVATPIDINGMHLKVYGTYDVIQIRRDEAVVIGKGKAVTAAMPLKNIRKV